ncbi:hypothetical protein JOL79_06820 [Microbispora sp. RL4-1S]|uniref:Portal protein n=1 Tax=Microbispora oryzae TaxID=2806554 RepID=A0A941AGZ6_9ACTN|nr:hypothetical protein [Microbispora oryzae]MBP2703510.1 hypothetical protein [Microbispora oryzae]
MGSIDRRGTGYEVTHTTRTRDGRNERSLTAAVQPLNARRINRGPKMASTPTSQPWQAEAWTMYDLVGELRFAVNWEASAVGRCRLVAARQVPGVDEPELVEDGLPAELLADFAGGPAGQSQLLRRATQQLVVAGDTYLVGRTVDVAAGEGGAEEWRAYSTEETTWNGGGWQVNPGDGSIALGPDDVIFRCWLPHPRKWIEAESSVRSALPVLRELHGLTQRVAAEIDSRLAGAGLLILPQEFDFPKGQAAQSGDARDGDGDFVETLIDYMVTPIKDRDTPAAVVPLVITAPGEHIGQAQLIRFWSELDDRSRELREEALARFARAADLPAEVIKGLSDSNHWSAWAIGEDAVQMHVAPLLGVLSLALTVGWFRPALAASGVPNADEYLVWYDTTPLELKPDKSAAAKDLYDRFAIGPDTLRRETGFGDDDAPTPDELRNMILLSFLERVSDPGLLLQALGISTSGIPDLAPPPAIPAPRQAPDDEQPADDGPPQTQDEARAGDGEAPSRTAAAAPGDLPPVAIVTAAEVAVMRALTYAGRRLLRDQSRAGRSDYARIPQHELHLHIPANTARMDVLTADAWTALQQVLPDRDDVVQVCDRYVRELLQHGVRHEPRFLIRALCDELGVCP